MTDLIDAAAEQAGGNEALVAELFAKANTRLAQSTQLDEASRAGAITGAVAAAMRELNETRMRERGQAPITGAAQGRLRQSVEARLGRLGALAPLLADRTIEDVVANGCDNVWITRAGSRPVQGAPIAATDEALVALVRSLASAAGRRFDHAAPELSLELPDGSRLHAIMDVADRPSVSIRRHRIISADLEDLAANGMVSGEIADFLRAIVLARCNAIVAGPFASGKTTLLSAMAGLVPPWERIVTIEDARELGLHRDDRHGNVVSLQTRDANIEGQGAVTAADLFRASLRMTPDRVIVGEVRGAEASVMLEAMSNGKDGSLSTIHTSSSAGVVAKLKSYARAAGDDPETTAERIAIALDFIVQLRHTPQHGRHIASIREVRGADGAMVATNELWTPVPGGAHWAGSISDERAERLIEAGWTRPRAGRWTT
ncbi:Flp pilus assembly complex ATPase component TadA [Glycomyces sp. TRM65418]|uniref:CpaF family protein n=1 Tax=Glycomyces sp. TRM65418 TaxID=2867006 RepID=UPI001CE5E28C|nr:ATPase, T2SS/T4P/T4SS family [Glycomyces sp. TRM65418]MCC3762621.1 Flp pilus assembly complex ATPase component TadA [Glycomyces sp. TRM65418]QZD56659.1 Flp pilus assembly complex ATPase component TadA [Glycomyces sp. TRM65418]